MRRLAPRTAMLLAAVCISLPGQCATAEEPTGDVPHIVFMLDENEYGTETTLPEFAKRELAPLGFRETMIVADANDGNNFAGLEEALSTADLLVISVRRRTPPTAQLDAVRAYLSAGKPLIGIRTASHAFALRSGDAPAGHAQWKSFDVDVLGCRYDGHYQNNEGTGVSTYPRSEKRPLMDGVRETSFQSGGTLYKSYDLGPRTAPLLRGSATDGGEPVTMPVAWTNTYGKSRVFYTSLGHPKDFALPAFNRILVNAAHWCLGKEPPPQAAAPSRDVYDISIAGNAEVERIIHTFEGQGETGDDSVPTPADQAVERFQVNDELEIRLVAAEPQVMQPLFMTWDERGRMWVVQYLQYPFPAGLKVVRYDQHLRAIFDKVPQPPPHHVPGADKITVFEDVDGDGLFDHSKDVITGLNIVSSVAIGAGGIWVLNPPYLLFYPDADRDDVPDGDPEVHLSGFGLEDTHSVANSLKWGPDGWLYGANGSTTTGVISSEKTKNVAFKGQMIWRYHPRTKEFEIFAEGGGNTFSLEVDADGRVFSGTNNGGTRGMHYAQGGYAKKNWGKHGPLTNQYALGFYEHMRHEGFEERFSQTFSIYEGGSLPESYRHTIISGNALHNRVTVSDMLPDTSTYRTVDRAPVVLSSDRWFRPVDVEVGPDGAVYMADWYDSRLTHVDPRDNWHKSSGRIYRLQAKGAKPLAPFDLAQLDDEELIGLFDHANKWFRFQAVRLLGERDDDACVPRLVSMVEAKDDTRSLEALWALNWKERVDDRILLAALAHHDPSVRRWGARLVADRREASMAVVDRLVELSRNESDVQVRSQLASTAKRLPAESCLAMVRQLVMHDEDASDLHIPLLLWWAIESKAESDRQAVLALMAEPALWSLPVVEHAILERLMERYAVAGGRENLDSCAQLLSLAPTHQHAARLMTGLMAAFRGRRITDLPPALAATLDQYQKSLGESDLALGLRLGSEDAMRRALALVADTKASLPERLACIEIMGQINQPRCVGTLLGLLNQEADNHAIKRAAVEALAAYDDERVGRALAGGYNSRLPDELGVKAAALRVLASRKAWALMLLEKVDTWQIAASNVPLDIVGQMKLHADPAIDRLIDKHWGKVRGGTPVEKLAQIERVRDTLRAGQHGDLDRGKAIFTQSCAKCHKLFGEGGQAGPELTGYERTNLDFMLMAIIDPSAAIREEFTNYAVVTKDGRSLTGLIENQDARTVTLRGVDGQATLVDRDQVEELRALPISLMPDGVLGTLNDEQIKDLFAYLMSRAPSQSLGATSAGTR